MIVEILICIMILTKHISLSSNVCSDENAFFSFTIKTRALFMVATCKTPIICLFNFYYEVVSENTDKEDMRKRHHNSIVLFYYTTYMYISAKGF